MQVKADFATIRDTVNTYAVFIDVARTITAVMTFSAIPVCSAGLTVVGNSTITGTLTAVTTLGVVTVNASGAITAGTGLTVTTGNLTMSAGQAIGKRVDDGDSGAAATIDWNAGNIHKSKLTANCTYTFSNPATGASYFLEVLQDGTGSRTVTWPAAVVWDNGVTPTLTTTINKKDCFVFFYNGAKYLGTTYAMNVTDTT